MANFRVKGLRDLDRALGHADKAMRKELRGELKRVAEVVAQRARGIAERKGLRKTGRMIRSIRPFALTGKAGVRTTASNNGFPYPMRLEYEGRGAAAYGPHGFLNPAVDQSGQEIERGIERALDNMQRAFEGTPL